MKINHEVEEECAFIRGTFNHLKDASMLLHIVLKQEYHKKQNNEHRELDILIHFILSITAYFFTENHSKMIAIDTTTMSIKTSQRAPKILGGNDNCIIT